MKKHIFVILILFLFETYSFSQNGLIKIELSPIDSIEQAKYRICPIFEVGYTNKVYRNKRKFKIKTPNTNSTFGIGYLYYNGFKKNSIPGSVPVLIENYKNKNPLFYFENRE